VDLSRDTLASEEGRALMEGVKRFKKETSKVITAPAHAQRGKGEGKEKGSLHQVGKTVVNLAKGGTGREKIQQMC